jgi:hypothetical protein
MAIVFAAACGRDITGSGAQARGIIRLSTRAFQATAGQGGQVNTNVVGLRVVISTINSQASAGTASTAHVIANVTPSADSLDKHNGQGNNNGSDTAAVITVSFPIQGAGVTYQLVLKAVNATGDTIYQAGPATFTSNDISVAGAVTVTAKAFYVGPGLNAARVVASPKTVNLIAFVNGSNSAQLSAQAYDASGAAISRTLYQWGALDTTVVSVATDSGTVFALNKRGSTKVFVEAANNPAVQDTVTVNVSLGASGIVLVSGGGQTAATGHALANPIVVKSVASDGLPAPGTVVNFQAQGGGFASPNSATANSSGIAQTTWTLGSSVGTQTMNVNNQNAPGNLSVTATATGTGGNSLQITTVSGTPTTATHGSTVTITVLVTNNGQPAPNIPVSFVPVPNAGSVSASPVNTDSQGHASTSWTLGSLIGGQTLLISAPNANPNPLGFTLTSTAASAQRVP